MSGWSLNWILLRNHSDIVATIFSMLIFLSNLCIKAWPYLLNIWKVILNLHLLTADYHSSIYCCCCWLLWLFLYFNLLFRLFLFWPRVQILVRLLDNAWSTANSTMLVKILSISDDNISTIDVGSLGQIAPILLLPSTDDHLLFRTRTFFELYLSGWALRVALSRLLRSSSIIGLLYLSKATLIFFI